MAKKIYIFTSFIGFGHNRVAQAVQQSLKKLYKETVDVSIINFFSLVSPEIEEFLSRKYYQWITDNPLTWKLMYDPFSNRINVSEMMNVKGRLFVGFVNMFLQFIFKKEEMTELEKLLNRDYSGKVYLTEREFIAFLSGELFKDTDEETNNNNLKFTGSFEQFYRLVNFGFERLDDFFSKNPVDGIIATQVYPCYFTSYLKSRFEFPLFAILTDYHVHSYWFSPSVDRYFVPQKEQAEYFIAKGVSGEKILDHGIPVKMEFTLKVDRNEFCHEVGIDPGKKIILIMGGGLGFGIEKLLEIFLFSLHRDYQNYFFIFICGNDKETEEKLTSIQDTFRTNILVFGHRDDIHRFMRCADLLITKPGGVTVTEAMNCHLPMVLIPVIKGQEEANIKFFERKKIAFTVSERQGTGPLLRHVFLSKEYFLIRERLKLYSKPGACINIAREIGELTGLKEV